MDAQPDADRRAADRVRECVQAVMGTSDLLQRKDCCKLLLSQQWVTCACREAVAAGGAEGLQYLEQVLRPGEKLPAILDDLFPGNTERLRVQVQAALAALAARTGDIRAMVERLENAVGALLPEGRSGPVADVEPDVRGLGAPSASDPVALLHDACMTLHSKLDQDGWTAMAVLDLACDFLGSPRQVLANGMPEARPCSQMEAGVTWSAPEGEC